MRTNGFFCFPRLETRVTEKKNHGCNKQKKNRESKWARERERERENVRRRKRERNVRESKRGGERTNRRRRMERFKV